MDKSLFYINFEASSDNQRHCIESIKSSVTTAVDPIYILNRPIIERKTVYSYQDAFVVLMPKHKILFINFGTGQDEFEEYQDDFIDDLGYIAKKYDFLNIIGRPRQWRKHFVNAINYADVTDSFGSVLANNLLCTNELIRQGDILISLATGSINEAARLGSNLPDNILDQIKRKIILFDGEQTRFICDELPQKRITIQGLAGTGKTELLLHKIKELYLADDNSRIVFTCHNEILADSLRDRVPKFFNFMKVEEQIQWEQRLWVMRGWGNFDKPNSGVYSYICNYYGINFHRFSYYKSFDEICKDALSELNLIPNFSCCFDYILIDESQDFPESFFKLCEKVTTRNIYVAGDIFQDIFAQEPLSAISPNFLLNKCYRTDPRTLMGAHAIGMGLFEKPKLRWLSDDEWTACGYTIKRDNITHLFELWRKPLRRFEDIDIGESDGITILFSNPERFTNVILSIIDTIKTNHPTVAPDDIGIAFMENIDDNFKLASILQVAIGEKYNWDVNIGYETKAKKNNTLFISNKNNIKGLEFPFVICIVQRAFEDNYSLRNSIYMMLTRSFVTSYLLISDNTGEDLKPIKTGIDFVNRQGYLKINEPTDEEKAALAKSVIKSTNLHKSLHDTTDELLDKFDIESPNVRKKIHDLVKTAFSSKPDIHKLEEFIITMASTIS